LRSSPVTITIARIREIKWAWRVALMRREIRVGLWWECQNEKDNYEDAEVGSKIILKWILQKYNVMVWAGFIWLWTGISGELL
jgi:hypothetical protein